MLYYHPKTTIPNGRFNSYFSLGLGIQSARQPDRWKITTQEEAQQTLMQDISNMSIGSMPIFTELMYFNPRSNSGDEGHLYEVIVLKDPELISRLRAHDGYAFLSEDYESTLKLQDAAAFRRHENWIKINDLFLNMRKVLHVSSKQRVPHVHTKAVESIKKCNKELKKLVIEECGVDAIKQCAGIFVRGTIGLLDIPHLMCLDLLKTCVDIGFPSAIRVMVKFILHHNPDNLPIFDVLSSAALSGNLTLAEHMVSELVECANQQGNLEKVQEHNVIESLFTTTKQRQEGYDEIMQLLVQFPPDVQQQVFARLFSTSKEEQLISWLHMFRCYDFSLCSPETVASAVSILDISCTACWGDDDDVRRSVCRAAEGLLSIFRNKHNQNVNDAMARFMCRFLPRNDCEFALLRDIVSAVGPHQESSEGCILTACLSCLSLYVHFPDNLSSLPIATRNKRIYSKKQSTGVLEEGLGIWYSDIKNARSRSMEVCRSEDVRLEAVRALSRLEWKSMARQCVQLLSKLLLDENPDVRRAASSTLCAAFFSRATDCSYLVADKLEEACWGNHGDNDMRTAAAEVIIRVLLHDPFVQRFKERYDDHKDAAKKIISDQILGACCAKDQRARSILISRLEEETSGLVSLNAIISLSTVADQPEVQKALLKVIASQHSLVSKLPPEADNCRQKGEFQKPLIQCVCGQEATSSCTACKQSFCASCASEVLPSVEARVRSISIEYGFSMPNSPSNSSTGKYLQHNIILQDSGQTDIGIGAIALPLAVCTARNCQESLRSMTFKQQGNILGIPAGFIAAIISNVLSNSCVNIHGGPGEDFEEMKALRDRYRLPTCVSKQFQLGLHVTHADLRQVAVLCLAKAVSVPEVFNGVELLLNDSDNSLQSVAVFIMVHAARNRDSRLVPALARFFKNMPRDESHGLRIMNASFSDEIFVQALDSECWEQGKSLYYEVKLAGNCQVSVGWGKFCAKPSEAVCLSIDHAKEGDIIGCWIQEDGIIYITQNSEFLQGYEGFLVQDEEELCITQQGQKHGSVHRPEEVSRGEQTFNLIYYSLSPALSNFDPRISTQVSCASNFSMVIQ